MTTQNTNRILLGQIGAAHGIKGAVRIAAHTQDPLDIGAYGPLHTDRPGLTITIDTLRLHKNVVVAHIKGIASRRGWKPARSSARSLPCPISAPAI